jgi:hypothetical protein
VRSQRETRPRPGGVGGYWNGSVYVGSKISRCCCARCGHDHRQLGCLKALPACPDIRDFTDWLAAMEKGDASRAVDIIEGKGCVDVNKGEMVEFERLLTHPFVVCVRPIGQSQCFWTSPFAISPQPQKRR